MKKDFWTEWGGKSPWMEIKHEALWFLCKLVCCMALQNLYFSASCSYRFECEQQKKIECFGRELFLVLQRGLDFFMSIYLKIIIGSKEWNPGGKKLPTIMLVLSLLKGPPSFLCEKIQPKGSCHWSKRVLKILLKWSNVLLYRTAPPSSFLGGEENK